MLFKSNYLHCTVLQITVACDIRFVMGSFKVVGARHEAEVRAPVEHVHIERPPGIQDPPQTGLEGCNTRLMDRLIDGLMDGWMDGLIGVLRCIGNIPAM